MAIFTSESAVLDPRNRIPQTPPLPVKGGPPLRPALLAYTILGVIVCLGAALIVATGTPSHIAHDVEPLPLLATGSIVILAGMAALYFYMYRFYRDEFYAVIAAGWVGNAFYMFLEGFLKPPIQKEWEYGVYIYLFAQISFIPFYAASFKDETNPSNYRAFIRWLALRFPRLNFIRRHAKSLNEERYRPSYRAPIIWLLAWFTFILATLYVGSWWRSSGPEPRDVHTALVIATLGGIFYASNALIRVGRSLAARRRSLAARLKQDPDGTWARLLPTTFYIYAGIQFLYPLRLLPHTQHLAVLAFALALSTKVLNSFSAATVLLTDFDARLRNRSALEDLGALTASIEHDITNPLHLVNVIVDGMKRRFQKNSAVQSSLQKIEEQNRRISAVAEIVGYLIGGDSFYGKFMAKTSLGDLVNKSIQAVKAAINTDGIHFKTESEKVLYARAYSPMLQQALVNVLKNAVEAIRATKSEAGVITIQLKSSSEPDRIVVIEVSDTGCGIPDADLHKLGHFFSTKKDRKANSGVGIFISNRILGFHGGKLEIQNNKNGKGALAIFSLPAWPNLR
jgi:signal transduction histidine kinase